MEAEVKIRRVIVRAVVAAAVLVLAWTWGAVASAQGTLGGTLPRVYVFTQVTKPGEKAPPDQEVRRASVADVRAELRKSPALLKVVDIPLDADVMVEVARRESLRGGRCLLTIRLRPTAQTTAKEFHGEGPDWKEAALLVADIVRRYVNEM